ncbi:Hpt domain-containing protein [Roseibacillus ishigakijimensis]|nr:Hpt domain-containing protein [Roseibacillus ishigakijimensis]
MDDLIDEDYLQSLGGREDEEIGLVLEDFLSGLPDSAHSLRQRLEAGERERVREEAHALKGSARMCGFAAIGNKAAELEEMAAGGQALPEGEQWSEDVVKLGEATQRALR